jgi:hypothetical protein
MFKGKVLLFSLLLVFATSLYAGEVDECLSSAGTSCSGMIVNICPQGDFEYIREGCGGDADYIWVEVLDGGGVGIEAIPWTDFWLNACDPGQELCLCASPVAADSLTNAAGRTTIGGRIAGGGCILSGGMYIAVQGKIIVENYPTCDITTCLDIEIHSPDFTGDCNVSLADFQPFTQSYNKADPDPLFNPCFDFNDDNAVSLSDFAFFAEHYQHVCF